MQSVIFRCCRAVLKVGGSILVGLSVGILASLSADGQNMNGTANGLGHRYGVDQMEKKIDLKMDMPGGGGPVEMLDVGTLYLVRLPVGSQAGDVSSTTHPPPDVSGLGLQVWLLDTNGATISQDKKPFLQEICFPNRTDYWMYFAFDRVPPNEVAGVIFRVKGKLYSREITHNMIAAAGTPLNALCGRWWSQEGDNYEFVPDGNFEHWRVPPIPIWAQPADVKPPSRIDVSNGRFLVDDDSIVFTGKDRASETNKYCIVQTMFGSELEIARPDGSIKNYVQR